MSDEENANSTLNVLLLGEVGVGKSTFVNSFANYIRHDTLRESEGSQLIVSIPTTFTIVDEEYEEHELRLEVDDFSDIEGPREYVFEVKGFPRPVRLIDTPGVGGLRARELDESNICRIKDYMLRFEHIHAICFVLKPNLSVLTEHFKCCFRHLLSCVDESAATNVIFAFSHTRSTFYHPGETMSVLHGLLKELKQHLPNMDVPLSKSNVFCFDNEGFRYRAILQEGFPIDEREKDLFAKSWQVSAGECRRLLQHVANCRPYKVGSAIREEKSANSRPYKEGSTIREEKSANFSPYKVGSTIREEKSVNSRPCKVLADSREERSAIAGTNSVPTIESVKESGEDLQQTNGRSAPRQKGGSIASRGTRGGSKSKKNKIKKMKKKKKKGRSRINCFSRKRSSSSDEEDVNVTRQKTGLPGCSIL